VVGRGAAVPGRGVGAIRRVLDGRVTGEVVVTAA
jgi:hypothetical protein